MNEFSVFFLIVCIFAFDAFCMNPSDLGLSPPSSPENVVFGECFVVPEIRGGALTTELHNYHHICPVQVPHAGPEPLRNEKVWYVVGSLKPAEQRMKLSNLDQFDYIRITQSLIKFTFLRETIVEFVVGTTGLEFNVTFQSLQQAQAFYGMVYHDVNLSPAAPNKIGVLNKIMIRGNRKIDNNLEALREQINEYWYITFKNERGEPPLIFCQNEAAITKPRPVDKQLLLQVHGTNYILTFSSNAKAEQFSEALLEDLEELNLDDVFPGIRARFEDNKIAINS